MVKSLVKSGITFPFRFEKNGRHGRIKFWEAKGTYGTYFMYAGKKYRNHFRSFERAYAFLDHEFSKLDQDRANSLSLHPINHDVKTYHELEQILREQASGATLREVVEFFLAHRQHKRFEAKQVSECVAAFLSEEENRNLSPSHIKTLIKHLTPFQKDFGTRKIHEISAQEIAEWLASRRGEDGALWSVKTRRNVRGSLVSMSLYAQRMLNAIPDMGQTEFQKVKNPKKDQKGEVEIYTSAEIRKLLTAAITHDIEMIPAIVVGCFQGLRPDEFHAENAQRRPLTWEAFNWNDKLLHVTGQKVRSKQTRDIPLHAVSQAWLRPFKGETGDIWRLKKAFDKRLKDLCTIAGVEKLYDGFRHSYASYRVRHLKGNLAHLASEMGNSPTEIINSYKRNVTDKAADTWFSIKPPASYASKIAKALKKKKDVPEKPQ